MTMLALFHHRLRGQDPGSVDIEIWKAQQSAAVLAYRCCAEQVTIAGRLGFCEA
jgi:hypothetical protein